MALGASRVVDGQMELSGLLIILLMGVEIFRPMRDLRSVLHQGMVGMSAAQGIYDILDAKPQVENKSFRPITEQLTPSISFRNVQFSYPKSLRSVYQDLSFDVTAGECLGVVGPSGCGKSSLVKLILRFFDPQGGIITLGGVDLKEMSFSQIRENIAVVNQDTFLFHGTVGDNIRMGRPEASDEELRLAAKSANIDEFIKSLPQQYDTIIGEKGIKLSGGQRQRVAIARAILRDSPILILDEALSAVDAENEAIIQDALNKLMVGRTTIILAHRLSSIIDCDRIIVIDDGEVVETGIHRDLISRDNTYSALMRDQAMQAGSAHEIKEVVTSVDNSKIDNLENISGGAKIPETEGVIKAEGLNWYQVIKSLMGVIMPWKGRLGLTFFFGVARVLAYIGVGVASALIVLSLKNGTDYDQYLIWLWVLAPLAGITHWLESWVAHDMAFRLLAEMRIDAFRKLDALAPSYLVRRRTGDLMNLATHDIELIEYFFAHTVAPAFVAFLIPSLVLIVLGAQSLWIAVALLPFLIAVGLSPFLMRGSVDRLGSKAREASGELGAYAIDSIQGLGEIITFQGEERRAKGFDRLADMHIALRIPFFKQLTFQHSLLEVLTGFGGLAVVVSGTVMVQHGEVSSGILPLLTLLAMSAFLPVSEIAQIGRQLADTLGSTRRYYALENEPISVVDGPGAPATKKSGASLEMQGLTFSYPGQTRYALKDINLKILSGETVALVGTSGAGKTTTAQMLMRFWDPDVGLIKLNGTDLRDYTLDDLRSRIALVAQDTYLFNDTLRANILIAKPDASETELKNAIEGAALGDLIATLPDGLNTEVGERGTSLSGGQRQRVAIARAFLKNAPILILDEATSHLDSVNESEIRRQLDRLKVNRTTIIIAHRLSTIKEADQIIVLEEGSLVESGRHTDLIELDGFYAKLVSRQLSSVRVG